jgi:hypothetical protein
MRRLLPFDLPHHVLGLVILAFVLSSCSPSPAVPGVTDFSVEGMFASTQVRQGEGSLYVQISGSGLAGATVSLGALVTTVESNTGTSIVATVQVPHGVSLGARTLQVVTPTATFTRVNALTVTAITSAPGGDDVLGRGTTDHPFRSLTRAAAVAGSGDLVDLRDGTYGPVGESYPVEISGFTVAGQSRSGTVLAGAIDADGDGIQVLSGASVLRDLTLRDFGDDAIEVQGGALTIENVEVADSRRGVNVVGQGSVTLVDSTVTRSGGDNVRARQSGNLTIRSSFITDGGADGVDFDSAGELVMRGTTVTGNHSDGVDFGQGENGSASRIDLGWNEEPGNNVIKGNSDHQLDDTRDAGAGIVARAWGNDFGAPVSGMKEGPDGVSFLWRITGAGNAVDFGPAD